jgi:NAD(P)H-flavin reductase
VLVRAFDRPLAPQHDFLGRAVLEEESQRLVKEVGDIIGFRGPYSNVFPLEKWKGKNLVFVASGIALPPCAP